jgi:hypothetical protein
MPVITDRTHDVLYLTSRFGELNEYPRAARELRKPGVRRLVRSLMSKMWDEVTFVVKYRGRYGLLFEVELPVFEGDDPKRDVRRAWNGSEVVPTAKNVLAWIRRTYAPLAARYRHGEVIATQGKTVCLNRAAVRVFLPAPVQLGARDRGIIGQAVLDHCASLTGK